MSKLNRKYRLLLVDDEPRVTSSLHAIFRREYDVYIAHGGAQALELLKTTQIDVVVSDQRMPGMLGNELLAKISKQYPNTMRILLTGFMDKQAIVDSINEGEIYRFINKPWNNDEMRGLVAEAAKASELEFESSVNHKPVELEETVKIGTIKKDQALLMVEQKKDIRHQIRKFCSEHKIMIYGTQNIEQAVVAANTRKNIGVAIVELSVDPKGALQTINLLKQARPELITIALADELDAYTAIDLINQGQVFKYLTKPIEINSFQKTVHNAFKRHNFLKKNKIATQRYKVEKHKDKIVDSLQSLFHVFLKSKT